MVNLPSVNAVSYSGGNGTEENPYIISTVNDFLNIPVDSDSKYLLTENITLPASYVPKPFKGTFKGGTSPDNAKTITVSITSSSENTYGSQYGTGLFSSLHGNAYVANLKIQGTVKGTNLVGGVAGAVYDRAKIENCINYASVTGNGYNVGGICGAVRNQYDVTALKSCHNKGTVINTSTEGSWTGGITGHNLKDILNCSNNGNVTGNTSVGGITGAQYSQSEAAVKKCYNSGRILGKNYIGGIAGSSRYISGGILSSYNSGRVIATGVRADGTFIDLSEIYAGGITSGGMPSTKESGVTIKDCYNAGEVLGGRDINNIYSYSGCGSDGKTEATSNAVITNCYALNHTDSFYPTYKKPADYIKIKTRYQLNKAAMIGESALPSSDFEFVSSNSYPYPQIIGNSHESVHTEPQVTKPLVNVSATGLNKAVLLKWGNDKDFNHDMVEISYNGKVLDRLSVGESEYLINGLEENIEYTYSVTPLSDYKKAAEPHTLTCVTNVSGISDYTEIPLSVTNSSFSEGMKGFKIVYGSSSNISASDGSLTINDDSNRAYEVESDLIPIASEVSYKLQGECLHNNASKFPYVYINYYDSTKNKLDKRPSVRIVPIADAYSSFMIDYNEAPENAKYMSISLTTPSSYTGTAKFDNIKITAKTSGYSDRVDDETAVENMSNQLQIVFGGNDTYTSVRNNLNLETLTSNGIYIVWTSDNQDVIDNCGIISESAVEGQKVILTAVMKRGEYSATKKFNLTIGSKITNIDLYNPSFELGTDGYTLNTVGSPDIEAADFSFSKDKSLKIVTGDNENVVISGHETQIIPGESYSAYTMVYSYKGDISLSLVFLDGNRNEIKSETRTYTGNLAEWNTLGVVSESPSNAVYGYVKVTFDKRTECFIDDLNFTKTFSDLGAPISIDYVQSAAVSKNINGEYVIYTVVTDETAEGAARFVIVDVASKNIQKNIEISGASGSYAIAADNENNVYIGTYENGKLYKYVPGSDSLIDLGTPVSGQTHITSLTVDSKGNVYGGTYPGCYVFSLKKNQTNFEIISPLGANQPFDLNEQYAKSIAIDEKNNVLYVGTATHSKLYRYDLNTKKAAEILPDGFEDNTHIYNLRYENDRLFAYVYPEGKLLVMSFDANGQPTLEKVLSGSGTVSKSVNNISYFINSDRKISQYNYLTGEVKALNNQMVYATTCLTDVIDMKDGLTFIAFSNGIQRDNRLITYNLTKNKLEVSKIELPTIDYSARSIMTGPDGSIYTSNHLGGGVGVYNPVDNTKGLFYGLPQAESGVSLNGKMYFGTYTMAKIYEYNPEESWQMNSTTEINPKRIDTLGTRFEQDRPFAAAAGDGLVFFGTAPQYGKLGGAIAIYNPSNLNDKYIRRNIIEDQSITALAYKDGYLYGGTSIWGGIGAKPTQTESKFFVYDVANRSLVNRVTISSGSELISSLIAGPDGNIWGLCDGYLFMYNPVTNLIEYKELTFPELNSSGSVTSPKLYGANLVCGKDGYIYGVTGSKLFKLNPYSKEIEVLRNGKFILATVDNFGNIYYSDYSSIWKYSCYDSGDELIPKITFVKDPVVFAGKDDSVTDEITGGYSIVVTKFAVPASVTGYTYGMLLSEENIDFDEDNSIIAPAEKNKNGAFGILFYGNKFKEGKTYYVRPYIERNGAYTLGKITEFVFRAE